MAGTNASKIATIDPTGPAIILINPQLGENIGMAARAMLNNGLGELRLVAPRPGYDQEKALAAASGATVVLERATVFQNTEQAVADLHRVYGATARERDMTKEVLTPREVARRIHADAADKGRSGILFGPESKGLTNDDVVLCDAILRVPLNPGFNSLNLAQAVLLSAYEWFQAEDETPAARMLDTAARPADKSELLGLFEHLEKELHACGFLYPPQKAPAMIRNIRNLLQRAGLTEQETRTLRGVVSCLSKPRASSGGN